MGLQQQQSRLEKQVSSQPVSSKEDFEILVSQKDLDRIKQRQMREDQLEAMKQQKQDQFDDYVSMIERIVGNSRAKNQQPVEDEESKELQEMILPGSTDLDTGLSGKATEAELEQMLQDVTLAYADYDEDREEEDEEDDEATVAAELYNDATFATKD